MGWSHPDLSLEDLLKLIEGFVDMLILTSGYQSTGHFAHWDSHNIKKAFQWGIFFEQVFTRFSCPDDYRESVQELDEALSKMISDPYFPKGLAHLSSATLGRAREFISEHLIHSLTLSETHLKAFLKATIEIDIDELSGAENDWLQVYLEKLMLTNASLNPTLDQWRYMEDSTISSPDILKSRKDGNHADGDFTAFAIKELTRQQVAVSCITSAEACLDTLSKASIQSHWTEPCNSLFGDQEKHAAAQMTEEQLVESVMWNHWRTKNLSYMFDKRTIRLVSGAKMIFSAPKIQWVRVFERLDLSAVASDNDLSETMELLLLGCTASRWSSIIEHFMLVSCDPLTISEQYHEIRNFLQGRCQNLHTKEEMMNSKEKDILEYLEVLLGSQIHQLWKLPPTLAAIAIPSWSQLFRLYLSELMSKFGGDSSTSRCCTCIQDRKEHRDCEVAERIWCLHIFHVHGPHRC